MLTAHKIGHLKPGDVVVYHGAFRIVDAVKHNTLSTSGEVTTFEPITASSMKLPYGERDEILRYTADNVAAMVAKTYAALADRRAAWQLQITEE